MHTHLVFTLGEHPNQEGDTRSDLILSGLMAGIVCGGDIQSIIPTIDPPINVMSLPPSPTRTKNQAPHPRRWKYVENCRTLLHMHTRMCMCGALC